MTDRAEIRINGAELAVRILEAVAGKERTEGKSAVEILDEFNESHPEQFARLMRAAEVSARYVAEVIMSAPRGPSEEMMDKRGLLHALYLGLKGAGDGTTDYAAVLGTLRKIEGTDKLVYIRDCGVHIDQQTTHALWHGQPMCGFTRALARDWPKGHGWCSPDELSSITCAACYSAARQRKAG